MTLPTLYPRLSRIKFREEAKRLLFKYAEAARRLIESRFGCLSCPQQDESVIRGGGAEWGRIVRHLPHSHKPVFALSGKSGADSQRQNKGCDGSLGADA